MRWNDVKKHYPHRWLLVEAIRARSEGGKRLLDEVAVVNAFSDGGAAMRGYLQLHRSSPDREFYVLHTDREDPDIQERTWLGLREAR